MTTPLQTWDRTPMDGWGRAVDDWRPWLAWDLNGTQVGYKKKGTCPRCLHPITIYQHFYRGITEVPVTAECNCEYPHTGRPPEKIQGCGQHAPIEPKQPGQ